MLNEPGTENGVPAILDPVNTRNNRKIIEGNIEIYERFISNSN
jgi:hypothetical protein